MKAKFYLFAILFLFVFSNSIAQNIETFFEHQQTVPFQKLYLHTDREFYFTGDTLWFAAYLLNGESHTLASEGFTQSETLTKIGSFNLYIDLIDSNSEIVKSELFLIQNGFGSGYVSLSDSTDIEGNFLLRAYTDYLKNFGDEAFFTKTIQISEVKNSIELALEQPSEVELVAKSSPAQFTLHDSIQQLNLKSAGEQKIIDVSFLPEGGFLLAGESNCVAFKAVDRSGKGRDISGKLLDENGNVILTFKSEFKGAGKFYFYPKYGKTYTAKIDSFLKLDFKLPEIKNSGTKLYLINQDENKIQMVVQSKNSGRNKLFYLVCMHRSEGLFYKEIDQKKINSVLKIDAGQLGEGINRFVLLDNNLNPVSERLVFKEDRNIKNIEISLNKESFSTREEVELQLKSDNIIENELAQVSISVVDENYVNAYGTSQNIASYLLLDSELNGHIESPANYFISEENISAQTKLDLLMATNGWNNYVWNNLTNDSIKVEFEPQTGFSFKGHVKLAFGNKALTEGNVSLLVKSKSTTQFLDTPLDENGRFEFRYIVFYDSASVFAQARNKRDNHGFQFEMKMPEFDTPKINQTRLNQLNNSSDIPLSVYRQRYFNEMRLKEFYPDKNSILIKEVEVNAEAKKKRNGMDNDFLGSGDKTVITDKSDAINYSRLTLKLYLVAKGIFVRTYMGISGDRGEPLILMDGTRTSHIGWDDEKNPLGNTLDLVKSIEVFDGVSASMFGFNGIHGVINIITKKGDDFMNDDAKLLGGIVTKIRGFSLQKEYYSPQYTPQNLALEAPDYRNTLFWNPTVSIKNGEKELFFFTCDNLSRYKVFVEGLTENGKICLGSTGFEVNQLRTSSGEISSPDEYEP